MGIETSEHGTAIRAEGLVKRYGESRALDGFDITVASGTICGLLGPNGAGKTTAVRILATLLRPDGGRAVVAGFDVSSHPQQVRERIGLSGQEAAVDEILSGRQNLVMFARLAGLDRTAAGTRADELLARFELTETGGKSVKNYSGGMRRRLDLAATLILRPAVLFLDEPTTGLDPRNRNEVWSAIRGLVAEGTTVLLTTQYLDEADQLADHIVVIDGGQSIATGSPSALKAQIGGDQLEVVVHDPADLAVAAAVLTAMTGNDAHTDEVVRTVSAPIAERVSALAEVMPALTAAGIDIADVALRRPSLDDVFLALTGRRTDAVTETTEPTADDEEAA